MKKLVEVVEVENEGLVGMMGQNVMVFAMSYIYAGVLSGANGDCILLENARLVYETGPFTKPGYEDAQDLPGKKVYIMKNAIEAFGPGK